MTQSTPSINELKSYTEYNVSTPTSVFPIGFQYEYYVDGINVYVDGVEATAAGYTVQYDSQGTVTLTPAVPSGVVRLSRETNIDTSAHTFSAGAKFTAGNMDENFQQIRHSQQEVRDGFNKLSTDTYAIIDGLDTALVLAQDAAQDAQEAAVLAQGAADTVNTIIVGGKVGAGNVLDSNGKTQQEINAEVVLSTYDYMGLDSAKVVDGQAVLVKKEGIAGEFVYNASSSKTPDGGTVIQDSQGRKWERVLSGNVLASWFEPRADGITNDSPAFDRMELSESYPPNSVIDLGGKSYSVTTIPTQNKYVNGKFIVGGIEHRTRYESAVSYYDTPDEAQGSGLGWFNIGTNTLANADFTKVSDSISIGRDAQKETKWSYMNIAIGAQTMSKKNVGAANIAIGTYALTNIEGGARVVDLEGSRNIAIGSLAMHFATSAYQNVAIGRDAMHGVNASTRNVAVGYGALSAGESRVGLSGKISNLTTIESYDSVAVGARAGSKISGYSNVLIGKDVATECKDTSFNTLIGHDVAKNVGVNTSYGGKKLVTKNLSGTYVQTGNTITVTVANHSAIAGNYVSIFFNSGLIRTDYTYETQYIKVASVIDSNTFTITSPVSITTSGGVDLYKVESSEAYANGYGNTLIGQGVASVADNIGNNNTALGRNALQNATINNEFNVAVGVNAGDRLTSGFNNVFIGRNAGLSLTTATGVTCIGANATVTANNQIQLGDSTTTTYVYGTVQNRSDERDKADVRDTTLGLDFINSLRPVDYKWDMREDYIQVDEDGNVTKLDKDGSKKRNRYHHGFIAQEVPEGFGGYQDHKVQGGADVLSLGYDEFIAPLVKAVQELTQRVKDLEALTINNGE